MKRIYLLDNDGVGLELSQLLALGDLLMSVGEDRTLDGETPGWIGMMIRDMTISVRDKLEALGFVVPVEELGEEARAPAESPSVSGRGTTERVPASISVVPRPGPTPGGDRP